MVDRIPVLLDTDIGSDIDDAVALAYLLRQPRCELVGITTVSGDVARRAACAEVICRAAGRGEVPIHCGASEVLLMGPGQPGVPQYEAIRGRPHRAIRVAGTAVDFMRETIRNRPGEITLLTIGPYTNAAILFAADPEVPGLLKRVVSMGGIFFGEGEKREWNALVDPVATAMVYRTALPRHLSVGLDVTLKCRMRAEVVRERFKLSPLDVVAEMAEVWFSHADELTFHDPLAAAVIFWPSICEYVEGDIAVSIDADEKRAGQTRFSMRSGGRHVVAKSVDAGAFFEEYFSVVC